MRMIKNKETGNIGQAFALLSKLILSVKFSWFISGLRRSLVPIAELYEEEQYKIMQEFGDPMDDGNMGLFVGTERGQIGRIKMLELGNIEFEFETIPKWMLDDEFGEDIPDGYAEIIYGLTPILDFEAVKGDNLPVSLAERRRSRRKDKK